jgi:acyl-CoA thioester hydrolase
MGRRLLEPSLDPVAYAFAHRVRTRFAETDAMGVIHHASYLAYLEEARVAYLRDLGHPYGEVRGEGLDLAVLEVSVRYRQAVRFDEEVELRLVVGAVTGATFQIAYLLRVADEVRATAVTLHACVDGSGRAARLPGWVRETFGM